MANPTPDSNSWIPVASTLEGISVFAPTPHKKPEEAQPTTYKCPQCGATTSYNIALGGVACEHCGFTAPVQAKRVGTRAEVQEFTPENLRQAEQGWGVDRRALHCDACGAELAIADGAMTSTCPFCASNRVSVRTAPSDALRPRFLIPFKIPADILRRTAAEWLGKGWFHPEGLASAAVEHFVGIYLPFWVFDANIQSTWKAEVGYEHQESYYDAGSKQWRTRTVINWRWENGQVALDDDGRLICGSKRISRLILGRILPFDLNALTTYVPDFLAGWQAQTYDLPLQEAWELGKTEMREGAREACRKDIHSLHVRNFSMTADFGDEAWRYVLLPVWLAAYRFGDKTFQVMVNGQTGSIAGQKPVSWNKVWWAIGGLMAPGVLVGLISLVLLLVGVGVIGLGIAFILLLIGGIISFVIYRQAVDSEAS